MAVFRVDCEGGRYVLVEAVTAQQAIDTVKAIILDAFSQKKYPDMWSKRLTHQSMRYLLDCEVYVDDCRKELEDGSVT